MTRRVAAAVLAALLIAPACALKTPPDAAAIQFASSTPVGADPGA